MKVNCSFKKTLETYGIDINVALNTGLDKELLEIIDKGFYEDENTGCVFFKVRKRNDLDALYSNLPDLTGVECFINDVAIDDYADDSKEVINQGLSFANQLSINLNKYHENHFLIILTYDSDLESCTVRFHCVREKESWLDDDINSYDQGVVMFSNVQQGNRLI